MKDNRKRIPELAQDMPSDDGGAEMALDDARRIKVLSPGMLVFKRFIRNRLAVVGLVILFFMFTFSFLGPLFSPYGQAQVFKGVGSMSKEYASAIYNTELRYTVVEGENFDAAERAQFLFALGKGNDTFKVGQDTYYFVSEGEGTYRILQLDPIAEAIAGVIRSSDREPLPEGLIQAFEEARSRDSEIFRFRNVSYRITRENKAYRINTEHDVALATLNVYDAYDESNLDVISGYDFRLASTRALEQRRTTFKVGNSYYMIQYGEGQYTIFDNMGQEFAEISEIIVRPLEKSLFLSVDFKKAIRKALDDRAVRFAYTHDEGEEVEYAIVRVNNTFNIMRETPTDLIRMFENPTTSHPLGLDNNGMDLMTRLMYGGQVSLLVGFIVILIEVFIGVFIGGISGFFGGWIDTGLMRFVDLFNSIPFYPMVLIFGSVMDTLEFNPRTRIFVLMMVLGLLGWTGVARIVRGQILSLRELDFMVATEATGLSIGRRIFRHLIPNVMPLLIVYATAGLGSIIIIEATLGFLGLGVKYPLASWGSIINVASEAFVMTNYWFMWIPAGLLILLTVLGFNFVGDGLRDAFDPKMKR